MTSRFNRPRQMDYNKKLTTFDNISHFIKIDSVDDQLRNFLTIEDTSPILPSPLLVKKQSNKKQTDNSLQSASTSDIMRKANRANIAVPEIKPIVSHPQQLTTKEDQMKEDNAKRDAAAAIAQQLQKSALDALNQIVPKTKAKDQLSYIKVKQSEQLPKDELYEILDQDIEWLNKLYDEYNDDQLRVALNHSIFEKIIQTWELNSTYSEMPPLDEACKLISDLVQSEAKINNETVAEKIYNYWKKQREVLGCPILRKMQRPSAEDTNHTIAFHSRNENNKLIQTRKQKLKPNEAENLKKYTELKESIVMARFIAEVIQKRERIKNEILDSKLLKHGFDRGTLSDQVKQVSDFQQRTKKLLEESKFIRNRKTPKQQEDEKNVKIENFAAPIQTISKLPKPNSHNHHFSDHQLQNHNIASFLASIIIEAHKYDITKKRVDNIELLNQRHVIEDKHQQVVPFINDNKYMIPSQHIGNYSGPQQQIVQNVPLIRIQPPKINILYFQVRKRTARCNRVMIDRYIEGVSEVELNDSYLAHSSKNSILNHKLLRKKMDRFRNIIWYSDDEEETGEEQKNYKKNLAQQFKQFKKLKLNQQGCADLNFSQSMAITRSDKLSQQIT